MKQKLKRFGRIYGYAHTGWNTLYEWNNSICSQSAGKYCVLECVSQKDVYKRQVLRPAFQLAVDDDLIRKNSFQFQLMEVVVNDSVTREAISRAEERKFLRFVKEDPCLLYTSRCV